MKTGKILLFLSFLMIIPAVQSCSSEKEMAHRRNLMIPHKDELPVNKKYSGVRKKPYNKKKQKKNKKRYSIYRFNHSQIQRA